MVHKERIWELVARRLAGEITTTEQRELEELLEAHPDLHFSIDLILSEWKLSGEKDKLVRRNISTVIFRGFSFTELLKSL